MNNEVKVSITSDSLKYEGQTTMTKAAQVIAFLSAKNAEGSPESPVANPPTEGPILLGETSRVSPRQMLVDSEARVNSEKIAALVYYIKKHLGRPSASPQDIKILFGKAGEPMPKNFARDLKDAVRSNYVFEVQNNEYEITEFGSEAVQKKFALEHTSRAKSERRRSSKSMELEVREEVANIELAATDPDFPAFHSLNKGQQILWICGVVDQRHKIGELNPKEIVYLIDRLKGNVTTGTFTALNETNIKKGYLKPSKDGFKVTQVGLDRLIELKNDKQI